MKQTPVEWLADVMRTHLTHEQQMQFEGLFQQAMDMEQKNNQNLKDVEPFENVARPVIKYLCENHHPNTTIIITQTNAEVLEGVKTIGTIKDYIID